jgi:hypothetical protein
MWARGGSNGKEESASEDKRMTPYPKYTTTVIGAHSVPDWYEVLDRLVAVGQLSWWMHSLLIT